VPPGRFQEHARLRFPAGTDAVLVRTVQDVQQREAMFGLQGLPQLYVNAQERVFGHESARHPALVCYHDRLHSAVADQRQNVHKTRHQPEILPPRHVARAGRLVDNTIAIKEDTALHSPTVPEYAAEFKLGAQSGRAIKVLAMGCRLAVELREFGVTMLKSSYKVATVWGIPIRVHISLLILLGWIVLSQGANLVQTLFFLVFAVLFFTSIALHELGHSFVAIRKGCRVREITLMFMGGVAKMERIPSKPADEFLMAIAGPAVSMLIGAGSLLVGLRLSSIGWGAVGGLLKLLGTVNLFLACFNLIPAFPMDGGRVLRALLTKKMGRVKATFIASRIGRFVAVLFGLVGLFGLPGVPGFEQRNLILVAIAFFIYISAGREYTMVRMQAAANQAGMGSWFGVAEDVPPDDDDVVTISPPPYEKGPESRTELKSERDINRSFPWS